MSAASPPEFDAPPLLISELGCETERKNATTRASLISTKFQVEMLKRKANENRGSGEASFSCLEAITAHIGDRTRLSMSVDIRRRMQPPLPKSYLGNAVLDVVALECAGDLVLKSLSYAAGRIRETINKVTNEYVNSTIDFLRGIDDLSPFQDSNTLSSDDDRKGIPYGNPNLSVTSWLGTQFHGVDFGWGKEIHMGPVDYGSDGDCVISSSGGHDSDGFAGHGWLVLNILPLVFSMSGTLSLWCPLGIMEDSLAQIGRALSLEEGESKEVVYSEGSLGTREGLYFDCGGRVLTKLNYNLMLSRKFFIGQ
ncbi:Agmatine hydroxycinnamoyltransferase 1 [Sesamum alatum]|uniref:Agmatine hydroxycinnamoyltransferase 1 n=1 Tax=Sesamum alatum TaxID=300844 RepID=A0AAE1Y7E1_9LAMI|nr:Agmatine hydroxycinnamoyltransferase 1 [Sesamum alatum]